MRRLALFVLALLGVLSLPQAASAQETPEIRLTLLSQTPWNSSYDPIHGRDLILRFRAENVGSVAAGELSIGVTLFGPVGSRTAYETALLADTGLALHTETFSREGTLEPDEPRDFELVFPLDSAGLDQDDSGIYPVKIDLRSGFTSLAALRSAAIFLVRKPEEPLALSWTFVLDEPIAFGPDGALASSEIEIALEPEGRLAAQIQALSGLAADDASPAVDVAVSPMLLTQLAWMRDGYEAVSGTGVGTVSRGEGGALAAEEALGDLLAIANAPNVRISALPYASPELPSLLSGGLSRDVLVQIQRGRDTIEQLMETAPTSSVFRPPGAALDEPTLHELASIGVSTLVAGPATVEPSPQPLGFAGPPTASIGEDEIAAIVPEPNVMALLQSSAVDADPVRAAQVLLGELATIWQEQPGLARGIAIVLSEDLRLPPSFYSAFTRGVAGAPWLSPTHASEFALEFPPDGPSVLTAPAPRRFATTYVEELKQARRQVATYRSMLVDPSTEPDRLDALLLLAESRQYLSNPDDGLAFIASVHDSVGAVFGAVSVDSADEITLTSSTGAGVPVTVTNGSADALHVSVLLESPRLRGAPRLDLELAAGEAETVTFRVDVRSTGRFEVRLRVVSPGGRILDEEPITVRSTVYNRIALVITIAAALVLLGLWVRRLLPRRTS
ncbi:MAG: DUF6049 family protein [Actinomycetota bacterium]